MLTDELRAEVARLKAERDAVVLAHYYVPPEVQELADHVGDSFALARLAATLPASTLVFAGVRFMAESAKLLSPDKTVLMPDPAADCPMAHMVRRETVEAARERYGDDLAVVCYVNSTAEVKSWSDVCVTSSNAVKIVRARAEKNVLFVPDRHLGRFVAEQVPEKNVILNDGFCPIHQDISAAEVAALKAAHPGAPVLAHPECGPEALALASAGRRRLRSRTLRGRRRRSSTPPRPGTRATTSSSPSTASAASWSVAAPGRESASTSRRRARSAPTWRASPRTGWSAACATAPGRWACRPPRLPTPRAARWSACSSWGPADVLRSASWGQSPIYRKL